MRQYMLPRLHVHSRRLQPRSDSGHSRDLGPGGVIWWMGIGEQCNVIGMRDAVDGGICKQYVQ